MSGDPEKPAPPVPGDRHSVGVRLGLTAAVGLGFLVSGLVLTRPGRRLVGDVFGGKRRTPLESQALDDLWEDPVLGRRKVDVQEVGPGRLVLTGRVRDEKERDRARAIAETLEGVVAVEERLEIVPGRRSPTP